MLLAQDVFLIWVSRTGPAIYLGSTVKHNAVVALHGRAKDSLFLSLPSSTLDYTFQ